MGFTFFEIVTLRYGCGLTTQFGKLESPALPIRVVRASGLKIAGRVQ